METMKIAIATDTNSSMLQETTREPDIFVLPMPVILEGQMYLEGVDIHHAQLYEAMRQHKDVSSSQPSPGQLLEFWEGILRAGYDEIVYIPMSSGLSGSCHTAVQLSADYQGKVHVVDNHRISVTQMESVYCARRLAEQGKNGREIKAFLEAHAYDASIYITVDSLEYLKKGGRITPAAAALATILNLKPVLTIQGDKLDAFAKVRGMKHAAERMIEAMKQDRATRFGAAPDAQLQIETAGTFESAAQAESWRQLIQAEFPNFPVSYVELPCSIACHVAMNAAGAGIIQKSML